MNIESIRLRMHARFDLAPDQADVEEIDRTLRSGVEFRGTNLWVLILAILIASIGLNVNSTAVIVGAMLISPLMGPIMALGYGAGINDSALIRSSLFNLALAVALSLMASTLYFLVTPLSQAHSELLARTAPSIWDVLIAFFGGLAGVIGITRRVKSNLIPGVAIATALMPPLCTAGYGLAMRNPNYFFGAFYLFTINCVFIAIATLLMTRWMDIPSIKHVTERAASRKRTIVGAVIVLTLLPSLYLAVHLVEKELFEQSATKFVREQFRSRPTSLVLSEQPDYLNKRLHVALAGKKLGPSEMDSIEQMLPVYGMQGVELVVNQSAMQTGELTSLKADLLQELLHLNTVQQLTKGTPPIVAPGTPQASNAPTTPSSSAVADLYRELAAQFPDARSISVLEGIRLSGDPSALPPAPDASRRSLSIQMVVKRPISQNEQRRLRSGIQARLNLAMPDDVQLIVQTEPAKRK